ncbi:MAG: methionyl-tRNA formyltransferase [Bradymonadia bacterium]|jgi:methionyl-tRNA formyltransferase
MTPPSTGSARAVSRLRVAFITNANAEDVHLIRRVAEEHDVVGIIRPAKRSKPPKRRHFSPAQKLRRVLRGKVYARYYDYLDASIADHLFAGPAPAVDPVPIDIPSDLINDAETRALVRSWRPDVLILSGAPILKPALFSIPKVTINVHMGLSPDYRGEHTLFVPLARGDYARIAGTLHRVDAGVDTGPVLARVYPELSPTDSEPVLIARVMRMIGDVTVDFLSDLTFGRAHAESGGFPSVSDAATPTPDTGFNIRYHDRRLRQDAMLLARRFVGHGPPRRPSRIELHY